MRGKLAVGLIAIGMLCLVGCKPGTYYPFGQKVQNTNNASQKVYYVPATSRPVQVGQPRTKQVVSG